MQKVFYGKQNQEYKMKDLSVRESITLGAMVIVIVFLGVFPQSVIKTAKPAIQKSLNIKEKTTAVSSGKNYKLLTVAPNNSINRK